MEILHVNNLAHVQFTTDVGTFRRFEAQEWYKKEGGSWLLVETAEELEKEYQKILEEEPAVLGLDEDGGL